MKIILLSLLLSQMHAHAAYPLEEDKLLRMQLKDGDEKGNGGDMCESRIKNIKRDISEWIEDGNAIDLHLPAGVNLNQYNTGMAKAMAETRVFCSNKSVFVQGVEKTCKNFQDANYYPRIVCNFERFMNSTDEDQYLNIHHEYANIAMLEKNDGTSSNYYISNQITGSLHPVVANKLMIGSQYPAMDNRIETIKVNEQANADLGFQEYKSLLNRAARTLAPVQMTESFDSGAARSITFAHFSQRRTDCDPRFLEVQAKSGETIEGRVSKTLSGARITDSQLVDMEIISIKPDGHIGSVRVFYCP